MAEPITLTPNPPVNPGLDYAELREEGVRMLQELAGEIWTDYNEHDPGVTTLEQLCYALTELSYRAEIPLADLLTGEDGEIHTHRQALFIPRRIFPVNPVTEDDYRKLLIDRVAAVANAWLTPCCEDDCGQQVDGLYDITVWAPRALDPCAEEASGGTEAVVGAVRQVYNQHRNVCEDLASIELLEPLPTVVSAVVTVDESKTPAAILAGILFRLGLLLAPEPRRRSLRQLLDRGETPSQIFNGPLLLDGFIDDDELAPWAPCIPVQEVVRTLVASPGVTGAREVEVWVEGDPDPYRDNDLVPVPEGRILELDTSADRQGRFSIRLVSGGVELHPKAARVERELARLWAEQRRTYDLESQYRELLPFPEGEHRPLRRYTSIQNQYPGVYGIGENGLPEGATATRRGQAKQLKGYLLVFEQLLADFFAQLARAKDLYSTADPRHTYFFQYLDRSVPDVEPLLKKGGDGELGYHRGLPRLVHSQDPFAERRNRFLALLLGLYAERLDGDAVSPFTTGADEPEAQGERLLTARRQLLEVLVAATGGRGRGFDVLGPLDPTNAAGMQLKVRIQLGLDPFDQTPLCDALDQAGLRLAQRDAAASLGRPLRGGDDEVRLLPTGDSPAGGREETAGGQPAPYGSMPLSASALLRGQSVSLELLTAAASPQSFRLAGQPGSDAVELLCRAPGEGSWRRVCPFPDRASAVAGMEEVADCLGSVARCCQQLYLVEHTLLRWATCPREPRDEDEGRRARPWATASSAETGERWRDGQRFAEDDPFADEDPFADQDRRHEDRPRPSDNPPAGDDFTYSFTLTAVYSPPPGLADPGDYRRFVHQVLRQNTPAHIVLQECFLPPRQMCRFERLYWEWREALKSRDRGSIESTSARLRSFLERCQGPQGGRC